MNLGIVEIKAFVPARDFALSLRFYEAMGFRVASNGGGVAYLHAGNCSFLLQDFYVEEAARNLVMHLLVEDVEAWHAHLVRIDLPRSFPGTRMDDAPQDQPWAMRDFHVIDPGGVCWCIAQNLPKKESA